MSNENRYAVQVDADSMEYRFGEPFGVIIGATNAIFYNPNHPIRWERVTAPTVGRAWKAPVYMGSDGQEIIDFNNQIEIAWDEEI